MTTWILVIFTHTAVLVPDYPTLEDCKAVAQELITTKYVEATCIPAPKKPRP